MHTKIDDDDLEIPELTDTDWARMEPNRYAPNPGEKTQVFIDGAVGYRLRLIPSNKVLARFESTLEAWPVIIDAIERGRSPRTLSLDWVDAEGNTGSISAGARLESFARISNGEPHPYLYGPAATPPRRVAEG